MAASTADRTDIKSAVGDGAEIEFPMAVVKIYKGIMVSACVTSHATPGYAIAAADTANTRLVGISSMQIDNSAGSAGDKSIPVQPLTALKYLELDATSPAIATWVGRLVYVVDDHTVALAATTTNDIVVGLCVKVVRTGTAGRVLVDLTQRA